MVPFALALAEHTDVSISKRTSSAFDHTEVSFNTTAPMRTAGNGKAVPHGNDDTVVSFGTQSRPPTHKPSGPDSPAVRATLSLARAISVWTADFRTECTLATSVPQLRDS